MQEDLMNAQEAADYLRISLKQIHRLANSGKLPVTRVGHKKLFWKHLLHEYLEKNTTPAAS